MHVNVPTTLVCAILAISLSILGPASAHHKPGHDKGGENSKADAREKGQPQKKVQHLGPPPWAPAHGYRTKHRYKSSQGGRVRTLSAADLIALPAANAGSCNREVLGAVLGAATGAAVGTAVNLGDGKILAKVGGAVAGALIGGALGRAMDQVDQNCVGQSLEHAPTGTPIGWRDGSGQTIYEVIPTDTYKNTAGRHCRSYQTAISIGGRTERADGTACRRPDGSWENCHDKCR